MAEKEKEEKTREPVTTSMGLPRNTASALCYGLGFMPYLGWLVGLLFFFFEKDKQVRFHALQSMMLFGSLAVLMTLFRQTIIFGRLWSLLYLGQFILWLMLIYKTYHGEKWVLPYVGVWAEKQVEKMKS